MNILAKTKALVVTIVILSLVIVAMISTIGYSYFRSKRPNLPPNPQARMDQQSDFVSRSLEFSENQRNNFCMLRDGFRASFDSIDFEIQKVSNEIMVVLEDSTPDMDKIDKLIDEYGTLQKSQKKLVVAHLMQVRSICNPQQLPRFEMFMRQMNRSHMRRSRDMQGNFNRQNEHMRRGRNCTLK